MFSYQLLVSFVILVSCAAKLCVPPETTFYWKSPCTGQNFTNLLTVTDLQATQNGVSVDTNGGLNMDISIDLVITGKNNYGSLATPLINIDVYQYTGLMDCNWEKQPTFGKLEKIDGCTIITSDCHMTDTSQTITTASINMKSLLGSMIDATVVGDYYALAVTTLDGDKPLQCVWSQDKVIQK